MKLKQYQVKLHLYSRLIKKLQDDKNWIGPLSRSRFFNKLEDAEGFALFESHRWAERDEDCAFKYYIVKNGDIVQEAGNDIDTM